MGLMGDIPIQPVTPAPVVIGLIRPKGLSCSFPPAQQLYVKAATVLRGPARIPMYGMESIRMTMRLLGRGKGFPGRGLLAGGFVNAVMDTDLNNASVSQGSTSYHNYDGTAGTVWGSGAIDSGVGINLPLNCGNCHNPHGGAGSGGNPTYRILRPLPTGAGGSGYEIGDESEKDYTVDDANGRYFEQNYGGLEFDIGSWCSQCHTRYEAPADSANTDSGDPIYMYRHTSDGDNGLSCMDCHVAHGTSASMGPNSGAVAWPDGTTTPGGDGRSSLLRIDNRGLCISCHQNP